MRWVISFHQLSTNFSHCVDSSGWRILYFGEWTKSITLRYIGNLMEFDHELNIRPYKVADETGVIRLWHRCQLVVPHNDPKADIARKMKVQPELFLVAITENRVVGTVMAGYEGHRGWINYLAVDPEYRRQGIGRRMMMTVEKKLKTYGCPKINLQVRETNTAVIEFYRRLGYHNDHVLSLGKLI